MIHDEYRWYRMDKTNATCTLCGCTGAHYCTGKKQSHGMDFESENKHLDEDKAWDEFISWQFKRSENVAYSYQEFKDYAKIGLLIEYLKSRCLETKTELVVNDLCVEALELKVKSLKPVDEVDELAEVLRIESASYRDYQGADYWPRIARKAIEIIKGKA